MCQTMKTQGYQITRAGRYLRVGKQKWYVRAYLSTKDIETARQAYESLWKKSNKKTLKDRIHVAEYRYKVKIEVDEEEHKYDDSEKAKKVFLTISA